MAIEQALPDQFLLDLATSYFTGSTLKCALYTSAASLGKETAAYTTTNEVSGTGYAAGGVTLVMKAGYPQVSNGVVYIHFDDIEWSGSSFTARAGLIYCSTNNNYGVAVLDFGRDYTTTGQTFRIKLGTILADALLRIQRGQ